MKLHIYKEDGTPYWVVAFATPPHNEGEALARWCYENFGPGCRYFIDYTTFKHRWINEIVYGELRFSEEKDVNWFALRWMT